MTTVLRQLARFFAAPDLLPAEFAGRPASRESRHSAGWELDAPEFLAATVGVRR